MDLTFPIKNNKLILQKLLYYQLEVIIKLLWQVKKSIFINQVKVAEQKSCFT